MQASMAHLHNLICSVGEVKTEQDAVDIISSYTAQNPKWYDQLPPEAIQTACSMIDTYAPVTLGYDQGAVVAGLIKAFKFTPEMHNTFLELIGCSPDGDKGNGLKVTNHEVFWNFVVTISATNLDDVDSCASTLSHPTMAFLEACERHEGAVTGFMWMLTDPGTDPNSDDEKSIQFLEKARHLLNIWPKVLYIITAKGSLNERYERVAPILTVGSRCIVYDTSESKRFYAPPAFSWECAEQPVYSFEQVMMISNEYGPVPDHVSIIGQLCPHFAAKFLAHLRILNTQVRVISYQGIGFNQLGTNVQEVIHPMSQTITWCNSDGACQVTTEMLNASFAALTMDSPNAASYRAKQIFVFLHTNTAQYFQNMFKGFSYVEHYVPIMTKVAQMISGQTAEISC